MGCPRGGVEEEDPAGVSERHINCCCGPHEQDGREVIEMVFDATRAGGPVIANTFNSQEQVERAILALEDSGFSTDTISVLAKQVRGAQASGEETAAASATMVAASKSWRACFRTPKPSPFPAWASSLWARWQRFSAV